MLLTELRIGNFVSSTTQKRETQILKVYSLSLRRLTGLVMNSKVLKKVAPVNWEPIPLDDGWLNKFGIEQVSVKGKKEWRLYVPPHRLTHDEYGYHIRDANDNVVGQPIKFVHQFQNIYFALCGDELEINRRELIKNR